MIFASLIFIFTVVSLSLANPSSPITVGATCTIHKQIKTYQSKKYTCFKSGKKLVWSKGLVAAKTQPIKSPTPTPAPVTGPSPSISPSPTPSPTPSTSQVPTVSVDLEEVTLEWSYGTDWLSDPGTLLDPEPETLQDNGMNSSLVLRATISGKGVSGVTINWTTNDNSADLQLISEATDSLGFARIWYISGENGSQTITARVFNGKSRIEKTMLKKENALKTVGRPVIVGFIPPANKEVNQVKVTAEINSDPIGTYYAFANFANFYTGLQSVLCNGWEMYSLVCLDSRGKYKAREGHFSVWDGKDAKGNVLRPVVVERSDRTKCSPFDHEGSGQMCFIAFDWLPGDEVAISMEKVSGAPNDYERLRVSASNVTTGISSLFAVIDVPGGVKLNTEFGAFNEHYLVKSAESCFNVELRSFTIKSVEFKTPLETYSPIRAYAYGNVVAEGQTLCQNYGFETGPKGIEIFSGGKGRFVAFKPALNNLSGRLQFRDSLQSKLMIRDIPLGRLAK